LDQAKRAKTLKERGLDLADARLVFAGETLNAEDRRRTMARPAFKRSGFWSVAW
jgi:uncharacterized DUF497 family protein